MPNGEKTLKERIKSGRDQVLKSDGKLPDEVKPLAGLCVLTADCVVEISEKFEEMPKQIGTVVREAIESSNGNGGESSIKLRMPNGKVLVDITGKDVCGAFLTIVAVLGCAIWLWHLAGHPNPFSHVAESDPAPIELVADIHSE